MSDHCKPVRYELFELGQLAVHGLSGGKILLPGGILGLNIVYNKKRWRIRENQFYISKYEISHWFKTGILKLLQTCRTASVPDS